MNGLNLGLCLDRVTRGGSGGAAAAWNPGRLPGTPREWLAGPDWCFTDGSAAFTAATNQSLSAASNTGLQTGGASFWFSCWANHTTVSGDQAYAGKRNTNENEWGLWHRDATFTRFQVLDRTSGSDSVVDTTSATAGSWRHLFCWYDSAANTLNIAANGGTPVTAANIRTLTAGGAPFRLGAFGSGTSLTYNGRLASVAFGKSPPGGIASVATTIRDRLYAGGNGIVYTDTTSAERTAWGLVSWWDLVRSGNFTDSHGSNNLTNNNGVGFGAGLPRARAGDTDPVSAWVDRWQGTTVAMTDPLKRPTLRLASGRWIVRGDGVNDCILINAAGLTLAQPYTAWAAHTKTSGTTTNGTIADSDSAVQAVFYYGDVPPNASATLSMGAGGGTALRSAVTSGATAAVAVFNGASSRLRTNQVEVTGNPGTNSLTGLRLFDIRADIVTGYRLAGDIASFGLLNSEILVGDQAQLEAYLNTIYPSY